MKLVFLDTETTGIDNARLIQLSYQKFGDEIKTDPYNPGVPIEFGAMGTHHITQAMVDKQKPFKGSEDSKTLQELLDGNVLVAHNSKFDMAVLKEEGVNTKWNICTMRIAKKYFDIDSYKLQALRYFFHLDLSLDEAKPHDAEGDVIVLVKVFEQLMDKVGHEAGLSDPAEILKEMVKITNGPIEIRKFLFGKHRGETFEEVAKKDKSYLQWLLKQQTGDDADQDIIFTCNKFLK
jgi:exodeoxyribonuclease X